MKAFRFPEWRSLLMFFLGMGIFIIIWLAAGGSLSHPAQAQPAASSQPLAAWLPQIVATAPRVTRYVPPPADLPLLERLAADKPGLLGQPWFYGFLFGLILIGVFALVALSTDLMDFSRQNK